jgi:hypothetical protein
MNDDDVNVDTLTYSTGSEKPEEHYLRLMTNVFQSRKFMMML